MRYLLQFSAIICYWLSGFIVGYGIKGIIIKSYKNKLMNERIEELKEKFKTLDSKIKEAYPDLN
jgi:hypothetical protein